MKVRHYDSGIHPLTANPTNASTRRGRALLSLREMLLKGAFPPGKRLEEVDLSRRLGVSRPILRSVLDHLSFEGLLEPGPSGGYAARHFTLDDIRDAILARSTLEGLAAGLAAKRIQDPKELDAARKLNAELAEVIPSRGPSPPTAEEMTRFGDLNGAFHDAIVSLARSRMLSWCIQRVQSLAFASPAAVVLSAGGVGARNSFQEHEAILQAIEAGDAARADDLLRQHAGLAMHAIESALKGSPHSSRNIALALVGNKTAKGSSNKPSRPRVNKASANGAASERVTLERILDEAANLFCEKGFYAATTRELASRLDIQQASLYHHMSNKEELLNRICREVINTFLADLPAVLQTAGPANTDAGRNRISAFIDAHLQVMLWSPRRTLAMVTEFRALSRPHFAEISQNYKEYSRLLDSALKSAQAAGSLRTDISAASLRLALLNVLNWTPRWFQPSGALSGKELSSIYERVFWEGVVSPTVREIPVIQPLPAPGSRQPLPARNRERNSTLAKFIRAAAELFSKYGYETTSTRDLATLLGMEKATLYYHAEGKEDLLYAICKSSVEQLAGDVSRATEGIHDPLEKLQVWIQAHIASLLRDQTQHATSLAEARSLTPERLAEIVKMRKAYQARTRSLIEAGQKAGCIRTDIAAKYLGLILEGLLDRSVVWYRRKGELSPAELGAALCSIFISGAQRRS